MAVAFKSIEPTVQVDPEATEQARRARIVHEPVGWLLGPDLLGKLKMILRKRSDPREWMPYYRGHLHDERHGRKGNLVEPVRTDPPATVPAQPGRSASSCQDWRSAEQVAPPAAPRYGEPEQDVWFDYVADMGDGADAMYAVAYASMISFDRAAAPGAATETWPCGAGPERLAAMPGGAAAGLPRGQFLFVGGDSAYHVADAPTLRARVKEPFGWAFTDARANGHLPRDAQAGTCTRRIYGIPGNHDWYDNLHGFSLIFRLGARSPQRTQELRDPIDLPELERAQLASYMGILLPYGWQLWGLDIDSPMDARQQAYFESLSKPDRLIVATPSPGIAFGASIADEHQRAVRRQLGIPIPEVPMVPGAPASPRYRLDLSGDVHHYARYYPRESNKSYGSVVSGLGGAFHHPSFTRASHTEQKVEPEIEYPTSRSSRARIGDALLRPFSTLRGSWASFFLIALTLIFGFAATCSRGGKWLLDGLLSAIPGVSVHIPRSGGAAVVDAVCALGVIALAAAGVWGGLAWGRRVYREQIERPELRGRLLDILGGPGRWSDRLRRLVSPHRTYWLAWTIAVVAAAPLVLYPFWGPDSDDLPLSIATLVLVVGLPIAGAVVGWSVGRQHLARGRSALIALIGLVHAVAQLFTALACARMIGTGWLAAGGGVAAVAFAAAMLWAARPLFKSERRAAGAGLALLALVVFAAAMLILIVAADGQVVPRETPWWLQAAYYSGAGVLAMLFGATWFAWYLAVAGRLDAHNNELGGAARVTAYRQLIRFHVHRDGLTGYVIAVENRPPDHVDPEDKAAHQGGKHLAFHLVDVFTIAAPGGATQVTGASRPSGRLRAVSSAEPLSA